MDRDPEGGMTADLRDACDPTGSRSMDVPSTGIHMVQRVDAAVFNLQPMLRTIADKDARHNR